MPSKKVKTEASKRGKGDVKQSVKVSVRIGDTKPKRKRAYKRKPKGEGGLARPEETRTLYGNLPPPPPQQVILTPQIPSAFQPQPQVAGLLEDVKRERQNLLEDIKRETGRQIAKAQGSEQRGELARIGWIEPVAKPPTLEESIQTTAPSFTDIAKEQMKPLIEELSSTPFSQLPRKVGKKKLILKQSEEEESQGLKYSIPIAMPSPKPSKISEFKIQEPMSVVPETQPTNILEQALSDTETQTSREKPKTIQARERRTDEGRAKIYDEILSQYGFPAIKGDMTQEEFAKKIMSIFEAVNSGGKKRITKSNIQNYYGQRFATIEKLAQSKSKIPVPDIESQPLTQTKAETFNLV